MGSPLPTLQEPTVIWRFDGVPIDATQYDDHIVLHRAERHRAGGRGCKSLCTNGGCSGTAVIDKRVHSNTVSAWRAVCAEHGRSLAKRLSPALGDIVNQMIDAAS